MFNRYLWELYATSPSGQKAITYFQNIKDVLAGNLDYISLYLGAPHGWKTKDEEQLTPASAEDEQTAKDVSETLRGIMGQAPDTSVKTSEQRLDLLPQLLSKNLIAYIDGEPLSLTPNDYNEVIEDISLALHLKYPEQFFPFGYDNTFYIFQEICDSFAIPLPPIPKRADKKHLALYYGEINEALLAFKAEYLLSMPELCALMYDFGPSFLRAERPRDLPEPAKVWPLIAGYPDPADHEWLKWAGSDDQWAFGGNSDAKNGDVLIVYELGTRKGAPSQITHIGRAIFDCFLDPFSPMYNVIWLSNLQKIEPITLAEMRADPILAASALVKLNMMGARGGSFKLEEYDAILAILEAKGMDTSKFPRPVAVEWRSDGELADERDVEVKLVEPLLERLGYSEADWVRQLPLRMGRGERNYPDYAIQPNRTPGNEQAEIILETKFSIANDRALQETLFQAASYAHRLRAKKLILAAREGLWVTQLKGDGFRVERLEPYSWQQLQHPDELFKLKKVLNAKAKR